MFEYGNYESVFVDRLGTLHYVMNEPFGWPGLYASRAYRRDGDTLEPVTEWSPFAITGVCAPAVYLGRDALQVIALEYARTWCEDYPEEEPDALELLELSTCHLLDLAPAAAVENALQTLDWTTSLQACGIDAS